MPVSDMYTLPLAGCRFMVGFAIEASAELSIGVSLDLTIIRAGLKADIALFKVG
jgi:hypothetical protein